MKIDLLQNKYNGKGLLKVFFADVVCFLVVAILSFGFCYSYFSDKVDVTGKASTAVVSIQYRHTSTDDTASENIYARINGGSEVELTSTVINSISPGDKIVITGYAVNTSDVDVYVLARLEITTNRDEGNDTEKDKEVVWYNIENNKSLYVKGGLFQVGASVLSANTPKALSIPYTFEGERYTNDYDSIDINLTLHVHQKDYLDLAEDYGNYSAVGSYSQDSIYATHYMTGRKRDVWHSSDANVTGLTLADLETDGKGAYLINSCQDWMILQSVSTSSSSSMSGQTVKLNAYLDFTGTQDRRLNTTYYDIDGQGYTISNWTGSGSLIKYCYSQSVKNLGIDGVSITYQSNGSESNVGISCFIEWAYESNIENCFVIGASVYDNSVVYDIDVNLPNCSTARVGGLVAYLRGDDTTIQYTASLKNCFANINMNVVLGGGFAVGGLVGRSYPRTVLMENCYFEGRISSVNCTRVGLIAGQSGTMGYVKNCIAITNSFVSDMSPSELSGIIIGNANEERVSNLAYIDNTGLVAGDENYNVATKVGNEQTDRNVTLDTFKSVGALNRCFGWDTNVWATDIYTGSNGLPVLRVFYNF